MLTSCSPLSGGKRTGFLSGGNVRLLFRVRMSSSSSFSSGNVIVGVFFRVAMSSSSFLCRMRMSSSSSLSGGNGVVFLSCENVVVFLSCENVVVMVFCHVRMSSSFFFGWECRRPLLYLGGNGVVFSVV